MYVRRLIKLNVSNCIAHHTSSKVIRTSLLQGPRTLPKKLNSVEPIRFRHLFISITNSNIGNIRSSCGLVVNMQGLSEPGSECCSHPHQSLMASGKAPDQNCDKSASLSREWVSEYGLTSASTNYRSFRRWFYLENSAKCNFAKQCKKGP